jgi:osmotically-inducible protein OsmY
MTVNTYSSHHHNLDAEISTRVGIALSLQQREALRKLDFTVADGIVRLSGQVNSFHERQIAIAVIGRVVGVRYVIDEIRVAEILSLPAKGEAKENCAIALWRSSKLAAGF